MKRILIGIISLLILSSLNANAEAYYTNENGLPFTEYQYEVMVDRIGLEDVQNMPYRVYNSMRISDINENNYTEVSYEEPTTSRGTYYETSCKKINISKTCDSSGCTVVFTNDWKCIPKVKSYDVSGIRLSSTNFLNSANDAFYVSDGVTKDPAGSRGASNGVGFAFKVPSSGDIGYSAVVADVAKTGIVYGSYQHGVKSMNLNRALNFTFTSTGQGGVFEWGSYDSYFDQMGGVYIQMF